MGECAGFVGRGRCQLALTHPYPSVDSLGPLLCDDSVPPFDSDASQIITLDACGAFAKKSHGAA